MSPGRGWGGLEISTLLESMPEGVLILDAEGRILEVNAAAERFAHRPRQQLLGQRIGEMARNVHITDAGGAVEFPRFAATRALRGETVRNERRTFRAPEG